MNTIGNQFYQNLGKIFYAVAASDKVVRDEEFQTLKEVIKSHWMDIDNIEDEFGMDSALQIEIVFDWFNANENELHADDCFNDFKDFKKEHESIFTPKVERTIWRTCIAIADAFYGKNKAEKEMLAKIKEILLG
ncbi:tellurite resistance TerB family protein [Urechidicola croceus]|uniref:Co-chaperone DjlA N-terminal domain-containing protein n=1 Tax=Urechidicola croceus TaxID=1850246 RepID=A0A1D8P4M6_9FLAO|nr:hypothetical protein [Urechidicola croceus]AOW19540.1 hypothetical protein LPB138_02085 [Urechidicola croceus]